MRVTFVALGAEQLGISQLASIAKVNGHEVNLAFSASLFHDRFNLEIPSLSKYFEDTDAVLAAIEEQQPDVIAFSCITSTYQWNLEVAERAKQLFPAVKTVFGGVHISAEPDRALAQPQVDYVVVGEGDVAFPLILEDMEAGGKGLPIVNTRYKLPDGTVSRGVQEGFVQDLDALPFPDKTIWEKHIRIKDLYLIMASRGCPYTCSFCFNNFFARLPEGKRGKYVRQRSVGHVIEELKWAKKRYGIKWVDFQDDVFTVNKQWIREFCERYREEINVPFQCLIHPQYFDDEIAQWMSEAGCAWVQMGIQTMDEAFKHGNLRRYEDSGHIYRALESLNRFGIKVKVDQMLALPGEPIGSQETALKLYKQYTPSRIQTFWTSFLPGTDMFKQGIKDGTISEEQAERLNEGIDFYFFRNQDNIRDPELIRQYQSYEFLYKILPALPSFIKKRLEVKYVKYLPAFLGRLLMMLMDIYIGFRNDNPEFGAYARHYIFHMYAFFRRKLGLRPVYATKVLENISLNSKTAIRNKEPLKARELKIS